MAIGSHVTELHHEVDVIPLFEAYVERRRGRPCDLQVIRQGFAGEGDGAQVVWALVWRRTEPRPVLSHSPAVTPTVGSAL